jgi:hypothetical protein
MFPVLTVIFGIACWANLSEKRTAKGWGIAASLIYVLTSLWPIIQHFGSILGAPGVELTIGVVGLVAFALSPRIKPEAENLPPESNPHRKA